MRLWHISYFESRYLGTAIARRTLRTSSVPPKAEVNLCVDGTPCQPGRWRPLSPEPGKLGLRRLCKQTFFLLLRFTTLSPSPSVLSIFHFVCLFHCLKGHSFESHILVELLYSTKVNYHLRRSDLVQGKTRSETRRCAFLDL